MAMTLTESKSWRMDKGRYTVCRNQKSEVDSRVDRGVDRGVDSWVNGKVGVE